MALKSGERQLFSLKREQLKSETYEYILSINCEKTSAFWESGKFVHGLNSKCSFYWEPKSIYFFRNREEAGWFVLQNVPLLDLEQESTIPAQWVRTSTSPWSIRNQTSTEGDELQASEWGFICIIAAPRHSLITPRRDSLACFPGTVCSYITYV